MNTHKASPDHKLMTKEPREGGYTTSYLEAARWGKNSWWRYLLGILLIVCFWFGIGSLLTVASILALSGIDLGTFLENPSTLDAIGPLGWYVSINMAFPLFLLGTVLATMLLHRRHPRTLVTAGVTIHWRRVAHGFGVWFGLIAIAGLLGFLVAPSTYSFRPDWRTFVPFALLALILTPIQTTSEELFFRGYLAHASARISTGGVFLVVAPSVIFMLLHLANTELSFAKNTFEVVAGVLYYFTFGALLAWVSLKDGTTELALGIHAAHNLFAAAVLSYNGSSLNTPALFHTDREPNAIVNLVTFLVLATLFSLLIFRRASRKSAPASLRARAKLAE